VAAYWTSISYGNGCFTIVGNDKAVSSPDGINWAARLLPINGVWRIAYGNGTFVAVQDQSANAVTLAMPSGATPNATYYPVNSTTDTFQLAATSGGTPITLNSDIEATTVLDATYRAAVLVESITPNTSVTVTSPAISAATNTLSYRKLDVNPPLLKGWSLVY
jgi:hypothetical protein